MMSIVVNVGHKNYGYTEVKPLWMEQLDHYINNVSTKYGEKFVAENIEIAKDIISGKKINWAKYAKIAGLIGVAIAAFADLTAMPVSAAVAFAPHDAIDLGPLDKFTNSVWWTMFKAGCYIATPLLGWAGWTILFSGTNTGKRTTAKVMLISIIGGLLFLAGAPWAKDQLVNLVSRVFNI